MKKHICEKGVLTVNAPDISVLNGLLDFIGSMLKIFISIILHQAADQLKKLLRVSLEIFFTVHLFYLPFSQP